MAKKDLVIHIKSALDAAGINATKQQINTLATEIGKANAEGAKRASNAWTEFYSKWRTITTGMRAAWSAVRYALSESFRFETQTQQFKVLLGNIDEAKAHMADLKALGDTPPFSLDQFAAASRSLLVMSDGALGLKSTMEMVGDAAAATGVDLETMGHAVGRLYSFIRDGEPLSRAVMELRNMGVLTPQVCQELQAMQNAGATNAEMWETVTTQLKRYQGAMAETEQTGEGLASAIETRWTNLVRQFGDAFAEAAKGGMSEVLDKAKQLEESGSVRVWAEDAADWLSKVVDGAQKCGQALGWLYEKSGAKWLVENANALDRAVSNGTVGAAVALSEGLGWEGVKNSYSTSWNENFGPGVREATAKYEAERLADAQKSVAAEREKADKSAADRKAAEEKKLQDQLAQAQERLDQRNLEKYIRAKEKEEAKLIKKLGDSYRQEIARNNAEAAQLQERAGGATGRFERELAAFRDADLRDRTIDEEQARADAIADMQKQVRARGLSGQVESLATIFRTQGEEAFNAEIEARRKRGSFFATDGYGNATYGFKDRETEQLVRAAATYSAGVSAEESLRKIEANTKDLGSKLDELLKMKG